MSVMTGGSLKIGGNMHWVDVLHMSTDYCTDTAGMKSLL
jgi:hypothetical protein